MREPDTRPPSRGTEARLLLALALWVAFGFAAAATRTVLVGSAVAQSQGEANWPLPLWGFGVGFGLFYVLMTVGAWLVWRADGWRRHKLELAIFIFQWILSAAWAPALFTIGAPGMALFLIAAHGVGLGASAIAFWRLRPAAAFLLVPCAAWTLYLLVFTISLRDAAM